MHYLGKEIVINCVTGVPEFTPKFSQGEPWQTRQAAHSSQQRCVRAEGKLLHDTIGAEKRKIKHALLAEAQNRPVHDDD